jgi:hypothetical protein
MDHVAGFGAFWPTQIDCRTIESRSSAAVRETITVFLYDCFRSGQFAQTIR